MISVNEAIKLHEKYKTAGFVQSVRMDINELVKLVVWQDNELILMRLEIELMKNCMNCMNCGIHNDCHSDNSCIQNSEWEMAK